MHSSIRVYAQQHLIVCTIVSECINTQLLGLISVCTHAGKALNDGTFNTFTTYETDAAAEPTVIGSLLSIQGLPNIGTTWSAYSWINYLDGGWIQAHGDNYNSDHARISVWYPLATGGAAPYI